MFLKYSCDEDDLLFELELSRKTRGRRLDTGLENIMLPQLYNDPVKINPLKLKDLLDLLTLIPPVHHNFYRSLAHSEDIPLLHPYVTEDETESDDTD